MVDTRFYKNNGPFTLGRIAEICDAELLDGSKAQEKIVDLASMDKAGSEDLCFFFDKKAKSKAAEIKAKACMTTAELKEFIAPGVIILICKDPKLASLKLNEALYSLAVPQPGIAASARISPDAVIGSGCFIGENAVIAAGVKIGDNCRIEANAVIDENCEIGNNCRIGVGAHLSYCLMGNDCYIFSGARIGQDGFGFMIVNGQHKRIPQLGRVIIGNDVEVGANACVDRGALDDTVIGDGCRIDNLVQVAHNVVLGRGCILVSQVGIAGSTRLGDYVVLGGQVGLADHVNIGSGTQIAAQSGVMSDIGPGEVMMGYPAVPIKQFMRQTAFIQKAVKK